MSHSEFLLQRLGKTGVQRAEPSAGVWGVPEKPFFLFLLAAAGGKRGKRSLGTPQTPVKGWPPLTSGIVKANYEMFAILLRRAISS